MPACDTCRVRKIRCDRESPCGPCRTSQFDCTTSLKQPRAGRKSNSSLRQDSRGILLSKAARVTNKVLHRNEPSTTNVPQPPSALIAPQVRAGLDEISKVSLANQDTTEFDGETSLHAHSLAARDILFQALGTHAYVRDQPKMVAALNSLRQIVEVDKVSTAQKAPKLVGSGGARQVIYDLKLPPSDAILEVLRKSKEVWTFTFSPPMAFITRDQLNELCRLVFFRIDDYPTSTAVLVHGTLENLLQEFKWMENDGRLRKQYEEWQQMCRANLETSISNLDLLMPASMESAQALLMAASYCMEKAQISICKKLVIHGCMTVHSLGWHRSSSMKNDSEALRQQKQIIFWLLYVIDKNLSLRLGQASLIQDYDIDLPLPAVEASDGFATFGRINRWVDSAKIMDLIYQRLYSPGALRQPDAVRYLAVQELLQQVETIRPNISEKDDLTRLTESPNFGAATYMREANDLVMRSDEITYYALLCIIYRATPKSVKTSYDAGAHCVEYARAALDCHERCTAAFKGQQELWTAYLHWTVLNTPFIPFTTLFSHVLTNHDRNDLRRLHMFADSMSGCPTSQAAYKVSQVASVFVKVAAVYIESKEQGNHHAHVEPPKSTLPTMQDHTSADTHQQISTHSLPAWAPFDPFLDALGFAEDPLQGNQGVSDFPNANLENWFNGNQHIMGLLEDDLSYLDAGDLTF